MPHFWLRVAVVLYGLGLLYSFLGLTRKSALLDRIIMPVMFLAATLHGVALVERSVLSGEFLTGNAPQVESLLAFLCITFFVVSWVRYRALSLGVFVFPIVFLLSFAASMSQAPPGLEALESPLLRRGWIIAHVILIIAGYAALFLSFVASLIYLVQERGLKAKQAGLIARLPSLEVVDQIGYRALLLGFPFMTVGLVLGSVVAQAQFGPRFFLDPKVVLSLLMWCVYMLLLYTRWSGGWRGRRAAFLSTFAFLIALGAWAANYWSVVHRFVQS